MKLEYRSFNTEKEGTYNYYQETLEAHLCEIMCCKEDDLLLLNNIVYSILGEECSDFRFLRKQDYANLHFLTKEVLSNVQDKLAFALQEYIEKENEVEVFNNSKPNELIIVELNGEDKARINDFVNSMFEGKVNTDSLELEDIKFNSMLDEVALDFNENLTHNLDRIFQYMYDTGVISKK